MTLIDPNFAKELKKYGAKGFEACFNCGNCSAVCSHSDQSSSFPRLLVRYGVLGLRDEILASKEPWLCYACGDCTETCPRQADPGHYMAALRRYSIAQNEITGLTRLLFKSNPFSILFTLLLSSVLVTFLFTIKPENELARWLFTWLPFNVVHDMGMVIFGFTAMVVMIGVLNMIRHLSGKTNNSDKKGQGSRKAISAVLAEMATMKRYQECDREEDSFWKHKTWYRQPWFIHWAIMWGFIALFGATILDYFFKDPATTIWWPSRIIGSIAGLFMMYGATMAISYRLRKVTKAYEETRFSDWLFLAFLWIAGITGFWMEIAVAFTADYMFSHYVFLLHTIVSMELVILFAFSKFAHAVYRPLALYFFFKDQATFNN